MTDILVCSSKRKVMNRRDLGFELSIYVEENKERMARFRTDIALL